jgi:hypothetical protein
MSGRLSTLKSFDSLVPPPPTPQYGNHVKDPFQPCNCKRCFEDMVMHGAIVVTKSSGKWRPKAVFIGGKESMEGHHKDTLTNLLIARGKTYFYDHVITENLRALPCNLIPDVVMFHNVKPPIIPPIEPNCTCDECRETDDDDSDIDDDDSVVIRKRQWGEEEEEEIGKRARTA